MNVRDLEVWKLARDVSIDIHARTIKMLPKFEQFEVGSQIRRSAKSIRANLVEGFGRRRYKQEFIRFLVYAHASCDETIEHLDILHETGSLADADMYRNLSAKLDLLGRKLSAFIRGVEQEHRSPK